MHRTVLGHHDTSDAIKELEIIRMPNTQAIAIDGAGLYTQFWAHNPTFDNFRWKKNGKNCYWSYLVI